MAFTHAQIREILHNTASTDNYTGSVPNYRWGFGKLNIEGALKYAKEHY
jgi:hypothetical protein